MESTIQFIEVVKKQHAIYDTTHKDYKNAERKANAWKAVGREVGLSIESCKRKWKNLRDSYTKYLRSFRVGTKTSRKYQFWAHAEHMEFLRPFQGPGRQAVNNNTADPAVIEPNISQLHSQNLFNCDWAFKLLENCVPDEKNDVLTTNGHLEIKTELIAGKHITSNNKGDKNKVYTGDFDATGMFFLSLAKSVRAMPKKYQATVKMRCMKIINDAEIEIENSDGCKVDDFSPIADVPMCQNETQSSTAIVPNTNNDNNYEHFLYVMSPSRVEAMIDISSEDEPNES